MPPPSHRRFATPTLANERFYGAFNALDLDAMRACWQAADHVVCVHPGRPALYGLRQVLLGWAAIFEHSSGLQVTFTDEHLHEQGPLAVVTGIEEIANFLVSREISRVQATNVYGYDDKKARWYLLCHHGSPIALTDSS